MFKTAAFAIVTLTTALAFAGPKDDVVGAAKKVGDAANYSWKTTTEMGANSQFQPRPIDGKLEKGGFVIVTTTFGQDQTTMTYVIKGDKGAIKTGDAWLSADEAAQEQQGPGRFFARTLRSFKAPAVQAEELAGKTKELTLTDGVYSGDLTEEGAKSLMTMGGRGGNNPPEIAGAKGTAKFWVKDGTLTKFSYNVQGKMTFNNNEREIDRTVTVEIKDVGSTKVDVPEDAKKKIG